MTDTTYSVDYNEDLDILVIEFDDYHKYEETRVTNGVVVDLTTDGEVLGIEIVDASEKGLIDLE